MKKLFPEIVFILLAAAIFTNCGGNSRKEVSERIRQKIHTISSPNSAAAGVPLQNTELLQEIYSKDIDALLAKWEEKKKVEQLVQQIKNVRADGLNPNDYHLAAIEELVARIFSSDTADVEDRANLDLLLTDAFLMIASHLANGKTDAETIDPQWRASRRVLNYDLVHYVDSLLEHDKIAEGLKQLAPKHREYKNLKKALAKHREMKVKGGWEEFTTSLKKLEKNMTHPDVAELRKRLIVIQGDFYDTLKDVNFFDDKLHKQVVLFQQRNGLTADGVVTAGTIEALNIPVEERIAAIEANMERWRWLSDNLGERYVKVNIANYEMQVVENDKPVFISAAIVGKTYRKTPVFSAKMTYLVLAPTWTVPPNILRNDVLPAVRKNPAYLRQKNMKVMRNDGTEVNPATIDWKSSSFPYRIVQMPGKDNSLGAVKFMFPNEYSVYIHDTPTRELFASTDRSFSSGCIRIKKPLEFAAYLLQDQPEWTPEQIKKTIEQGKPRNISIKNPLPVHILYLTAWADDEGVVYFRNDVYHRDPALLEALKQAPPAMALQQEVL